MAIPVRLIGLEAGTFDLNVVVADRKIGKRIEALVVRSRRVAGFRVSMFVAVTVAFGTTAPLASFTVPDILPPTARPRAESAQAGWSMSMQRGT